MDDPQQEIKLWLAKKLAPRGEPSRLSAATGISMDKLTRSKELEASDPKKRRTIPLDELQLIAHYYQELPPGFEEMASWLRDDAFTVGVGQNWLDPFLQASRFSSQEELADEMGLSRATVNRLANDHSRLKRARAEELAALLDTTVEALMLNRPPRETVVVPLDEQGNEIHPDDPMSDEPPTGGGYNRESWRPKIPGAIPELDVTAGAGEGKVGEIVALPMGGGAISAHKVIEEWYLPMPYLREAVRDPRQSIVMAIDGDSMIPNYAPGDRVIIDLSQDRFEADGVYLISYDMRHPQVKRLQAVPLTVPPKVTIISDNAIYKPFDVELDLLRIHGKVCAYVGRR